MKINREWLFNVYQQQAGDEVAVLPAETDTGDAAQDSTILTQEQSSATADENTDTTTEEAATEATDTEGGDGDAGDGSQDATLDASAFTAPEGMELDTALIEQAIPLFKEAGISQEQSQKFVDLYAAKIQEVEQGKLDTFNQLRQDWVKQAKNDPEFGGDKFDENIASAKAALDKFGTPELSKLLNDFGVGDHPEMIRFMVSVGRMTQEDTPGNGVRKGAQTKSDTEILYPTS